MKILVIHQYYLNPRREQFIAAYPDHISAVGILAEGH